MTEIHRLRQAFKTVDDGDCAADPLPALWNQDDDEYFVESGFIDRFWLPLSIAVLAGWGSLALVLANTFGLIVILAVAGIVTVGAVAAVVLVRTGGRNEAETVSSSVAEWQDTEFRNAA